MRRYAKINNGWLQKYADYLEETNKEFRIKLDSSKKMYNNLLQEIKEEEIVLKSICDCLEGTIDSLKITYEYYGGEKNGRV